MASAMKGRRPSVAVVMAVCLVVLLALASCAHAAGGNAEAEVLQTTRRSSAKTMAFAQQSLFQCPCSNQFCDGAQWSLCSCNVNVCSCSCHNSAEATIPDGATIQKLPST